jgi:hypothetical protein
MRVDDGEWRYRQRKADEDEIYVADHLVQKATWPLYRHLVIWTALLIFLVGGGRLLYLNVFGVAEADAERAVFEESKSYVHGTIRDVRNLRVDYAKATSDGERTVIAQTVLHRVAAFDEGELPADLKTWVDSLRTAEVAR